jgi:peptidyl-prolyl cis-trans isomerase C
LSRLALVLFLAFSVSCTSSKSKLQDVVVVEVGPLQLKSAEFAERLAFRLKNFDALNAKNPKTVELAKSEVVTDFIHEAITIKWATENGIKIGDDDLKKEVDKVRASFPDDISFRQALAMENLSFAAWKKDVRRNLLQKKVFVNLRATVPEPSEEELRSYYKSHKSQFYRKAQVRLRQVVLENQDDAQRIYSQINKHSDFADLAKRFSVAPEASKGGDTGWISRGVLDVFDVAFKMPEGARSKVLKSPYGYHIFKVIGKKPNRQLSFNDSKDEIRRTLLADRDQAVYSSWLETQMRQVTVRRNDDVIAAISVETLKK